MQTLLVMALQAESQKQLETAGYKIFYCGVGSTSASFHLTEWINQFKPKQVINLGTAGSRIHPIQSLVQCTSFVQRKPAGYLALQSSVIKTATFPQNKVELPLALCGSGDFVENQVPEVQCDVYDMEAYSLAYVCQKKHIPFYSFKVITDFSDEQVIHDWKKNLKLSAESLLNLLKSIGISSDETN